MVTSSSTGGSSSWARLPVAAWQRSRIASGVTSRRRKHLKNGGLYVAGFAGNSAPDHMDHLYALGEVYQRIGGRD